MRLIFTVLITVLFATPAWADWLAVMDATPEGRLAKYAKFETEAEAQAHVDKFSGKYPDAFVIERPAAPFGAWKLDMAGEAVSIDVPTAPIASAIESEATRRIDSVIGDERQQKRALARAARLNAEVAIRKRSLTTQEQAEVDQLIAVDDYVQAVRDKAAEAVAGLDGLTQQEKLDFNASTDVAWPVAP